MTLSCMPPYFYARTEDLKVRPTCYSNSSRQVGVQLTLSQMLKKKYSTAISLYSIVLERVNNVKTYPQVLDNGSLEVN